MQDEMTLLHGAGSDEPSEIAEASGCYLGLDQIQRPVVHRSSPYPKARIERPSSSTRAAILRSAGGKEGRSVPGIA
jgi:hypothetical protein